mgnify:CR=1 FL=1
MDRSIALLTPAVGRGKRFSVRRVGLLTRATAIVFLPLWCMLAACQPTDNGIAVVDESQLTDNEVAVADEGQPTDNRVALADEGQPTGNGVAVTDERLTPDTAINQAGPLRVPLFDAPAGAWVLTGAHGACSITLEGAAQSSGGAITWSECGSFAFQAVRWTLDGDRLVLWSAEGEQVAVFRTDMMPPLSGQDAAGRTLTLSRD